MCSTYAMSQMNNSAHLLHALAKDEGILDATYNSFNYTDTKNNVWISSINGLNRFDGLQVINFQEDEFKSGSLKGKNIQSDFFEDIDGDIWFSTFVALNKFNYKTNSFEFFQCMDPSKEAIQEEYHVFYYSSLKNQIWLKVKDEIKIFDVAQKKFMESPKIKTSAKRFAVKTNAGGKVVMIAGTPYFGSEIEIHRLVGDKWINSSTVVSSNSNSRIPKLLFEDNFIWIACDHEIIKIDLFKTIATSRIPLPNLKEIKISDLVYLDESTLMLSTFRHGVWTLNKKTKDFSKLKLDNSKINLNLARDINLNRDGSIWIDLLNKGVIAIDFDLKKKNYFDTLLDSLVVEDISTDNHGDIWFTTLNNGLYQTSLDGEIINHFSIEDFKSDDFGFLKFRCLEQIDNTLWVSGDNLLFRYNKTANKWTKVAEFNTIIRRVDSLGKNNLILSCLDGFYTLNLNGDNLNPEKYEFVIEGAEDALHFGIAGQVMFVLDAVTFVNQDNKSVYQLERNNDIYHLKNIYDVKGVIYDIQSFDSNNYIFSSEEGIHFVIDDKLNVNNKIGIWENDYNASSPIVHNNKVFFGSKKGVHSFDIANNEETIFNQRQGLLNPKFSLRKPILDSHKNIWMGTNQGLLKFNPDSLPSNLSKPLIELTEKKINNRIAKINVGKDLVLKASQNNISFKAIGKDKYSSKETKLFRRIKKLEDEYIKTENGAYFHYDRLKPGTYTLELLSVNPNNIRSEILSYPFTIDKPYYQKIWFQGLIFLMLGLSIYGMTRIYVQRKLREQKLQLAKLNAQAQERNRIADELHDDMGSGLSVIKFLSEELINEPDSPRRIKHLEKVSEASTNLISSMREIIWALDTNNNKLQSLLIQMENYANDYLPLNNIKFDFEKVVLKDEVEISGMTRRNIFLIYKESLHNIVKHAQASFAQITLSYENNSFKFNVADNGKGLPAASDLKRGRGLYSMRKRAKEIDAVLDIDSGESQGTVVSLSLKSDLGYNQKS